MKETNKLFIKLSKQDPEYKQTQETLELNFIVEMCAINVYFEKLNKKYEKQADEIVVEQNNNIDFILIRDAFKRYAKAVRDLYLDPLKESSFDTIKGLIKLFEEEKIENRLSYDLDEEKKTKFIFDVKKFDEYKNFLWVFVKHIECYIRFYYENLRKKYFFDFEYLVDVCYENKNIEKLNTTLLELCNKHCKSLKKYCRGKK